MKKRSRFHYGYKLHMETDAKDGFVVVGIMAPTNLFSTQSKFSALVDKLAQPEQRLFFG